MARRYAAQPWTDQVHGSVRDTNFSDSQIALGKEIVRQLARGKNRVAERQRDLGQREQHKPGSYVRQLRYMRSRQVQPHACCQRARVESVRRNRESKSNHRQSGRQPAIPQEQHDDDKREAGQEVTRHALRTDIVLQGDRSELQAQPKLMPRTTLLGTMRASHVSAPDDASISIVRPIAIPAPYRISGAVCWAITMAAMA